MSLNISKVWLSVDGKEVLVSSNDVKPGDKVVVHMGNVIPFDGKYMTVKPWSIRHPLQANPLP